MRGNFLPAGCRFFNCARALACLWIASVATAAHAEPAPLINGSPQLFIQRGQSADITLDGKFISTVSSAVISHSRGLHVDVIEREKDAKPDPGHRRIHLSADADAALGGREVRFISASGVSSPLYATVGQYAQLQEKEPNNTPEQAQEIPLPITLAGKIDSPGDVDCFKFAARKGEQLVFDVHAARDRSPLDPLITIHNEAGHELALKVDIHDNDPVAVFEVPADGNYLLSVRDLQYRGGGDYTYRIDAGAIPYVQSVLPMSAQPGKIADVKMTGVNLTGASPIPLDLTYANDGEIAVRALASAGTSNAMKIDVNELPVFVDDKPAHSAKGAPAVNVPVDISGRIDNTGDENFVKFHLARKQVITIQTIARRLGSPVDALLTLRNSTGDAMQAADSAGSKDASITRELDAGDYLVSIRDLFFSGGPRFAYRLQIRAGTGAGVQDFSVRFLPDTPRISRGGNAIVLVDLRRAGEFKGDVTVAMDDLPPGVTCPPIIINDKIAGASGVLVLSAGPEAAGGSFPIHLRAMATVGSSLVSRQGVPMLGGREVDQAYLTVLDIAPFTIEAGPAIAPQRIAQLSTEADALATKLAAANPERDAAQAEWEKKLAEAVAWTTLDDAAVTSTSGSQFKKLDDDSILAIGQSPESDTYNVTANTDLAGITAIRLEAIPDPSLPNKGPGRNVAGNFVLSRLMVTIAPGGTPGNAKPVTLHNPVADFSQDGYPVIDAIEPKPGKGWAMYPRGGTRNQAVFFTSEPIGTPEGSTLTFRLDQQFTMQHTLGRFRLSATNDPQAMSKASVPSDIIALLAMPMAQRSPEAKAKIADYYASIDPRLSVDHARLDALRAIAGTASQMARLQNALSAETPQLKAEQEKWEKSIRTGHAWLPVEFTSLKSRAGATLTNQPDSSVLVSGSDPATDTYTLAGPSPIQKISAIRVEAISDPRLPGAGPGRSTDGNFVLSNIAASTSAKEPSDSLGPIQFSSARATFEQQNYPAVNALTHAKDAGWAIAPNFGRPAAATFFVNEPADLPAGAILTVDLDQQFSMPHHTLGRFRVWVTLANDPDSAVTLPQSILAIVKTPADKREARQKSEIAEYFRAIAPSLEPARRELAELKSQADSAFDVSRGKKFGVPFLLSRGKFTRNVKVTLEGYVATRDPNTAVPTAIGTPLKFQPLDLPAGKASGILEVDVQQAGTGPRYCVLKAEGTSGDDAYIEYSAPFIVTVAEK